MEINNNVNISIPGQYKIIYTIKKGFSKKTLTRIVIVKSKNDSFILDLKGDSTIYILKGSRYIEPGYNASYSNVDVSNEVKVYGNVNINVPGEYILKYSISKNGYSREKLRTIIVSNFDYQIKVENNAGYVSENKIIFTTTDANYDHVLLPDANISYSSVKSFAEYINSLGGAVHFVSIEGGTHSVTETVQGFKNPDLIEWMMKQERK